MLGFQETKKDYHQINFRQNKNIWTVYPDKMSNAEIPSPLSNRAYMCLECINVLLF